MDEGTFKNRTKKFALGVVKLVEALPRSRTAEVLGKQLLRAGTSVGANYRAACRGRSASDVAAKLGIVEEEADEATYWMELLVESGVIAADAVVSLRKEGNEILAMTVASIKTLRSRNRDGAAEGRHRASRIFTPLESPGSLNPKSKIQNPKSA
jgi:four helix bundle protein